VAARFADRASAGRELAERLTDYRGQRAVVLALPRGGVPVAAAVAGALHAQLDVFVVRKLGVPWQPELAFGAVASGGVQVFNEDLLARLTFDEDAMRRIIERESSNVRRLESELRGNRPPIDLADRIVIVVDDGVATGATMCAAVQGVRAHSPQTVIAATPVAPREVVERMAAAADQVVACEVPARFGSVGAFYRDFRQVSDSDVLTLLASQRE
jgi:predicted phosphoribosyltransferase